MMETTEEHTADEKTSNECRGGDGRDVKRRGGNGDTGGGGEASGGSFCCVRSSSVRQALIGWGFCAVAGAELCKNDTDTCQFLLLLLFPAAHGQGRIALGCQAEIPPDIVSERLWCRAAGSTVSRTPTRHSDITATTGGMRKRV